MAGSSGLDMREQKKASGLKLDKGEQEKTGNHKLEKNV